MLRFASGSVIGLLSGCLIISSTLSAAERWSVERARNWADGVGVLRGCNYLPSTASNSTEIWQVEDWREDVINKELRLAADSGLNSVRVFIQYLVWEQDPKGLLQRMDRFLEIASKHGIRTMWVLFDDCAFGYPPKTDPYLGPQGDPKPGEYSPYWTPSPGHSLVDRRESWPRLESYVRAVVRRFRDDSRVLAWDLYNEPGNSGTGARSHALVDACFGWARAEQPTQPLTVGLYAADFQGAVSRHWMDLSDIISFHAYDSPGAVREKIRFCQQPKRPVLCTECVIRRGGNTYQNLLPLFAEEQVGWYSWGLVQGKTQTWLHWESQPGGTEPEVWQHDLFRPDHTPFDSNERDLIRNFQWLDIKVLLPTSQEVPQRWRYTEEIPSYGWHLPQFDDASWYEGLAAFGMQGTPWMPVRTRWTSQNLWLRTTFQLDESKASCPYLRIRHDEHAEIYLNGVMVAKMAGFNREYEWVPVPSLGREALRHGKNVLAVHVHQTTGGQGIDVGLTEVLAGDEVLPRMEVLDSAEVSSDPGQRWTANRAKSWYRQRAPIKGFNYLPRTAVNSVEMWHADTFDPSTIDEELAWAQAYGYNSARVFLQYAAWEADENGFLDRLETFLEIADSHAITVMPVFFDDCCFAMKLEPWYMPQDDPVVGIINSGWVPSPGYGPTLDRASWANLRRYVQAIVNKYRNDARVLVWDIYNEPGPFFDVTTSFALAEAGLGWVRELDAMQPCTVAVWGNPASIRFTELSDINSIHTYGGPEGLEAFAKRHADRPLLVTEWLTRPGPSTFKDMLPVFARYQLGWYHWGFVAGRTQTYYSWSSRRGDAAPDVWMCDVLREDGTPFSEEEMQLVRKFKFEDP